MTSRLALVFALLLPCAGLAAEGAPSFRVDVMAALSKAGCNAGSCHGNQNGKGGFKLSLRGEDPASDYRRLTREANGRRIDRLDAAASLILTKPVGRVPHGGGVRLAKDSAEYEVLRRWVAAGAPGLQTQDPTVTAIQVTPAEAIVWSPKTAAQLKVVATFSDSAKRDVTSTAVYEPTELNISVDADGLVRSQGFGEANVIVRYLNQQQPVSLAFLPKRDEFVWPNPPQYNVIDRSVDEKLRRLQTAPSDVCSDGVFIRRVFLDALGFPPTAEEAKTFVESEEPDKREKLIDAVLARDEFADYWTLKWADVLRMEEKVLDKNGVRAYHDWIRQSLLDDKPLDQFVRELVTGRGSTYGSPAANYYRANRSPSQRGETTARLFLGVRLQCAQCHNHPFDVWTQDDYYNWASLFARIDYEVLENKRRDRLDKNEFQGEQVVVTAYQGEVVNARTGQNAEPQFLGGGPIDQAGDPDRLYQLADWLTAPTNRRFVKSQANWVWFHLMGRGVVEPVDDFRLTNPPSNPALLEALADELVRSGFQLRSLVRLIMNSRVYQADSTPNETNVHDTRNFARNTIRRLTAEQLLDAQSLVLGKTSTFNGYDAGTRAAEVQGVQRLRARDKAPAAGDRFLSTFGKPKRLLSCECERSNETSLNQALELLAGDSLHERLEASDNRLTKLTQATDDDEAVVESLYWATLCRPPTEVEQKACVAVIKESSDRLSGVRDVAWALLNAKAFIYRE